VDGCGCEKEYACKKNDCALPETSPTIIGGWIPLQTETSHRPSVMNHWQVLNQGLNFRQQANDFAATLRKTLELDSKRFFSWLQGGRTVSPTVVISSFNVAGDLY
jgi:hypothetical protein